MNVRLSRATKLELPADVQLAPGDHVRGWVAGVVDKLDGETAVATIVDWDFNPRCRHCGEGL